MVVCHGAVDEGVNDEASDEKAPQTREKKVEPNESIDERANDDRAKGGQIERTEQPRMGERNLQRRVDFNSFTQFHGWSLDLVSWQVLHNSSDAVGLVRCPFIADGAIEQREEISKRRPQRASTIAR